jgi:hypothetical protein
MLFRGDITLFYTRTTQNIKMHCVKRFQGFLISNFRRVLNTVCVLLGVSAASDWDLPTFRNLLSVPFSKAGCRVLSTQHSTPSLQDLYFQKSWYSTYNRHLALKG